MVGRWGTTSAALAMGGSSVVAAAAPADSSGDGDSDGDGSGWHKYAAAAAVVAVAAAAVSYRRRSEREGGGASSWTGRDGSGALRPTGYVGRFQVCMDLPISARKYWLMRGVDGKHTPLDFFEQARLALEFEVVEREVAEPEGKGGAPTIRRTIVKYLEHVVLRAPPPP